MNRTARRRRALLLGCSTYADDSLAPLRSPHRDVEELARVLREPVACRYSVSAEMDCTSRQAQRAIEGFLSEARVSDGTNLIYFSCHGVQDAQGRLYFAFADTEKALLGSTAVSADWVRDHIYASRSRATVVLVDCCFSGAFIKGMRARSSPEANLNALVRDMPEGSGVAVLTASGEMEVSFEDADSSVVRLSYFTDALARGISTGAADLNRDGHITVDELYDYIYQHVVNGPSPQRPRKLAVGEGTLIVADASASQPEFVAAARDDQIEKPVLRVRGVLGFVSFDGQWIVIGKDGVGNVYKGERRFHVSQLSGVVVKPATRLYHGFFQVIVKGIPPAPIVRFGPHAGRPPMEDGGSISFAKSANDDIRRIQDALEAAIEAVHRRVGPTRSTAIGEEASRQHAANFPSSTEASLWEPVLRQDGLFFPADLIADTNPDATPTVRRGAGQPPSPPTPPQGQMAPAPMMPPAPRQHTGSPPVAPTHPARDYNHRLLLTPPADRRRPASAIWTWIGRAVLWATTLFLAAGEAAAIALTVTDGWPSHTVGNAIAGLLCWSLPFAGAVVGVYIDLRRLRRRVTSSKAPSA